MAIAQVIFPNDACPADVAATNLSCVSQDVSVARLDFDPVDLPETCVAGTSINLDIRLGFVINANAVRYDIATWIAQEPGDIKRQSTEATNPGPSKCNLLTLANDNFSAIPVPPIPGVIEVADVQVVDNIDTDACYDVLPGSQNYYFSDNFPSEGGINVTCLPDANGDLTFQTLVSWDTGGGPAQQTNCDGNVDGFADTLSNSKCSADSSITLPVDVLSRLVIEKQTLPDGLANQFEFTGTIGGAPITAFSLSDGQEQELSGALIANYVISETVPPNFAVTSIACTNQTTGNPADVTVNTGTGTVNVQMGPDQFDVRCVFTNDAVGSIDLVKTASPTMVNVANTVVTYSFAVTNNGATPLANVGVSDPLTNLGPITCGNTSNAVPFTNGASPLDPGESVTCSASYTFTQADLDAGVVNNTATAAGTDDQGQVTDQDSAQVTGMAQPAVQIIKTAAPTTFTAAGQDIVYTFAVTNQGNVTLSSLLVSDPLSGLSAVTCAPEANPIADLAPGETVNCTASLTTTQGQVDAGNINNTATVTGSSPGNTNDVSDTDSAIVNNNATASIALVKTASPTTFNAPDQVITYTFAVTNDGNLTLSNVLVTDPLSGLGTITCTGENNPIADLAPAETVNCSAQLTTTQPQLDSGKIDNTATVTGSSPGATNDVTDTDSATVSSNLVPNIRLVKTASPLTFAAKEEVISYSFAVTNSGNATLTNVSLTDPLTGLGPITCTGELNPIADLVPDETVNCSASLTTTQAQVDAGTIENTATVTGSSPDETDDVSDTDSATVRSTAAASLSLVKTANPTTFSAKDQLINYTLAVTNDGGVTLSNVDVSDPLTGLSAVDCTPEANPIVDLAPDETVNCTASLTTTQAQVDAGDIDNTATATGSSPGNTDDVTGSDNATVTNTAVSAYSITKVVTDVDNNAADEIVRAAGDTISYEIVVSNDGQTTLTTVDIEDSLTTLSCTPTVPAAVLAPGDSITCTASYEVTEGDIENDGNPADSGEIQNTATVSSAELPDETDSASVTLLVPELLIEGLAEVCINDVPFVSYDLLTVGLPQGLPVTIRFFSDGGNGSTNPADYTTPVGTFSDLPAIGQILWPGAAIDPQGNGTAWPGWEQLPNGTWVEVADGLVPSLLMEFEVNPTARQIIEYPPRVANCRPPAPPPAYTPIPVPVNQPWALLLMLLSLLGVAWYLGPQMRR